MMSQEKTQDAIQAGLKFSIIQQNTNSWGLWNRKKNALVKLPNLINHQSDIEKKILYVKDPYKAKYQLLINKHEIVG